MIIEDVKHGPNWTIVVLELEVKDLEDYGKIEITPRWRAAGKSLLIKENLPNLELIEIRAGERSFDSYYKTYCQKFTLFFGKGNI
jgi:hypothetical protein